ncbi:DUF4265 domain-containing protein [Krasilnikovia sp. MM14-A1004]|uniref:DUF4265 domain-containing protein n=1 Tax=Krasilnikovia sp. MM14-A1004 TaxID=3373541 RepID=UPI00399C8099
MASDSPAMDSGPRHEHVALLAGTNASGLPVHEQVPAARLGDGLYRVAGTPALVDGCAAGDVVHVQADGSFQVQHHGGNVAIQAFTPEAFTTTDVERLTEVINSLGGVAEAPAHRRFLVVTVPVRVGFAAIEAAMTGWQAATPQAEWSFGNVYGVDGAPLNWWRAAEGSNG